MITPEEALEKIKLERPGQLIITKLEEALKRIEKVILKSWNGDGEVIVTSIIQDLSGDTTIAVDEKLKSLGWYLSCDRHNCWTVKPHV